MKISKLYQLIGDSIVEIPLVDIDELNNRLSNIENSYVKKTGDNVTLKSLSIHYHDFSRDDGPPPRTSSSYILFKENTGNWTGGLYNIVYDTGNITTGLIANNLKDTNQARITIHYDADGKTYCSCPPPRENSYENDIDTLKSSIDRHPVRVSAGPTKNIIYLGGSNASDTEGLYIHRGSQQYPFLSLSGALSYISEQVSANEDVRLVLQDNISTSGLFKSLHNIRSLIIDGNGFKIYHPTTTIFLRFLGSVQITNITFENTYLRADNNSQTAYYFDGDISVISNNANNVIFYTAGTGNKITFGENCNLTVSGTCLIFAQAIVGGQIFAITGSTFTGNLTGMKYKSENGGLICVAGKGANFFPGSTAGTCDANSKYF